MFGKTKEIEEKLATLAEAEALGIMGSLKLKGMIDKLRRDLDGLKVDLIDIGEAAADMGERLEARIEDLEEHVEAHCAGLTHTLVMSDECKWEGEAGRWGHPVGRVVRQMIDVLGLEIGVEEDEDGDIVSVVKKKKTTKAKAKG